MNITDAFVLEAIAHVVRSTTWVPDGPAFWAEPMTTAVMRERHKAERDERAEEVKRLSKRFGMLHGLSSLANLLALGLAHCHLWHIASRLQV